MPADLPTECRLTLTPIAYRLELHRDWRLVLAPPRRQRQALRLARKRRRGRAGQPWDPGALGCVRERLTGPSLADVLVSAIGAAHRRQMHAAMMAMMVDPPADAG